MTLPNYRLSRRRMLRNLAAAGGIAAAGTAGLGLAGCTPGAGTGPGTGGGSGYEVGSAQLQVPLGPEIEGVVYPEPYNSPRARAIAPFGSPDVEFRVIAPSYTTFDPETNNFTRWLEQTTGVKVRYELVPPGDEGRAKINGMISSGDLPDAFLTGVNAFFTRSETALYGQQGLFLGVNELIDTHCPEHLDLFALRPELRGQLSAPDGEMYSFAYLNECYHCYSAPVRMWINSDWQEKVGLGQPQTADELRALLIAFRDQNPSGLTGSIPMSDCRPASIGGADGGGMINYLLSAFTYPALNYIDVQGDQLLFTPVQDSYREGLRWIRSLFVDNLIDPNAFTQTSEQYGRRFANADGPLIGAGYGYSQYGFLSDVDLTDPENLANVYKPLAPVKGPGGQSAVPWQWEPYLSPGVVITKACKDPVMMARWADAQLSMVGTLSNISGPQGSDVQYQWATEGELGSDGRQGVYKGDPGNNADNTNFGWNNQGSFAITDEIRQGAVAAEGTVDATLEAGKLYEPFAVAKERYFPELVYTPDQAAQLSEVEVNLGVHLAQSQAQFCLGQLDINDDAAWNGYVERFKQIGSEQYLQIQTEAREANGI